MQKKRHMKKFLLIIFITFNLTAFGQWTILNSGTTQWLRGVAFVNVDTGVAVGYNGTLLRTTNGGFNWDSINTGVSYNFFSVCFPSKQIGYVTGNNGVIKTIDGGINWSVSINGGKYLDAFFLNNDTGYAVGAMGKIKKTTNGGSNWTDISISSQDMISVFFNNPDTGYVVTAGWTDAISKTIDGGINWTDAHPNTIAEYASIYFTSNDTGYVSSTGAIDHNILKTTDAGATWTTIYTMPSHGLYSLKFPTSNIGYAAGGYQNSSIMLKTIDAGANWVTQNINTTDPLFDCFFLTQDLGYAVGMNGTIVKTTNGGVGIYELSNSILINVYPNPTSDYLTIEISGQNNQSTNIILTNLIGQKICYKQIKNKDFLDLNGVSTGMYMLTVYVGEFTSTIKIIKE
jgi:photosystem II stability/assembly factor-like uncharacterized protein